MHPRQRIIDLFSTFMKFEGDRFSGWATDAKLRRSMDTCLTRSPESEQSENYWALYWYNAWQAQSSYLAKEHLTAYLQEPCYWTSQKTATAFTSTQYTISDCFQVAIAQVEKVLKGFSPNRGFVLKNYASAIFSSVIRETLRQRREVDICTPWGLLRKISQKRLVESLQAAGLSSETINAYVLAWSCFKTIYVPSVGEGTKLAYTTRQLAKPDDQTWDAIALMYNKQSTQPVNPSTLANWLLSCATAARNYLYPTLSSINAPTMGQDSGEWLEHLPGTQQDSLLTQLVAQEEEQSRYSQQAELNETLVVAIAQQEWSLQQLLQLYYGQGLTQQQIAQQLEMKQYTVSRRLTKSREFLLLALAQWSKDKLHTSVTSDVLKHMSIVLEEWLQAHYSSSFNPLEVSISTSGL